MVVYGDSYYFYILMLILIPAIIMGILQIRIKWYGLLATIFMIYFSMGNSMLQIYCVVIFYIFEVLIIYIFYFIRKKYKKVSILWIFVILSVLPLLVVKTHNIYTSLSLGFLGISYLTFKALQMIIEIYYGLIKEVNLYDVSYFIFFFPTITSGPIDRYRRFKEEINKKISRKEYIEYLGDGIFKLFLGISYKFIIAYYITTKWIDKINLNNMDVKSTISYMYGYSFYLFFDFAGYSLIAIGVSYILGVRTPQNFNLPFISKDIKEFWNRWHMTLSFWFRDYVYTPFVSLCLKKKLFKNRLIPSYLGYVITMGLMGLWHGTTCYYIIYGIYHGVIIVITDFIQRRKFYKKVKDNIVWKCFSILLTFNIICFGFLIFSGKLIK